MPEAQDRRVEAAAQDVQDVLDAGLPVRRQTPQIGAADQDGAGAKGECLGHVAAPADAAVEQDLDLRADRVGYRGEYPDGGGGGVEVVAAVVGDGQRGHPGVDGPLGVVDAGDSLEQEGPAPLLAEPRHVLPGRRCGPHPLAVRAEEGGCLAARGPQVGDRKIGQATGLGEPEQPTGVRQHVGGEPQHGPQVQLVGDGGAPPVPPVGEGPVEGDDECLGTGRPGPVHPLRHRRAGAAPVQLVEEVRLRVGHFLDRLAGEGTQAHDDTPALGGPGHGDLALGVHGLHAGR